MALVGTLSDEEVAKRLNRPIKSVQARRLQFRKRPFGTRPLQPWTKAEEALLGTMSDQRLAHNLQRAVSAVEVLRTARWRRRFGAFWFAPGTGEI